jgi:DnaJ-class molecular chaperone
MVKNYYEILGIKQDISTDEIRERYSDPILTFHLDLHSEDPCVAQRFREIKEAYSVLSNSELRAAYDCQLTIEELNIPFFRSMGQALPPFPFKPNVGRLEATIINGGKKRRVLIINGKLVEDSTKNV